MYQRDGVAANAEAADRDSTADISATRADWSTETRRHYLEPVGVVQEKRTHI